MRTMLSRLYVLIPCAVAAFLAWIFIPGTAIDRALFSLTARSFANPPFFITGNGSQTRPHTLRTLKSSYGEIPEKLPTVVSLGDDPDGFFQSSPPSPVDFAIILKNFGRLGETGPAIGIPLAWQETDIISLTALDLQLDALPSVITTAPLTRNPIPSTMPPAFRRASVPLSQVTGDTTSLPIINHIPIPNIVLGNKTSFAGFAFLESEPPVDTPHLLARWDDSIVFSFSLLSAMRHFQVPPTAIDIRLGEYIALSKNGPYIPIDKYGRLAFSPEPIKESSSIQAPALIDAPADLLSKNPLPPTILRNDLSSADQQTRQFSKSLVGTIASLTNPSFTSASQTFPRLHTSIELSLLGSLVLVLTALTQHPFTKKPLTFLIAVCAIAAIHFILVPLTNTCIPTLPTLAVLGTFAIVSALPAPVSRKTANDLLPESPEPVTPEHLKIAKKSDQLSIPNGAKYDNPGQRPETTNSKNLQALKGRHQSQKSPKTPVKKKVAKKAPKKATAKKTTNKAATKKAAKNPTKKTTRKAAKKAVKKTIAKAVKKTPRRQPRKPPRRPPRRQSRRQSRKRLVKPPQKRLPHHPQKISISTTKVFH